MDGDPLAWGVWLGLGFALGLNIYTVSAQTVKRLLRIILK